MSAALLLRPAEGLGQPPDRFFEALRARLRGGARALTLYGQAADDPAELTLTAVLEAGGALSALRTTLPRAPGFAALTVEFPALHAFERELWEQHGVVPHGHPWLKPIRSPGGGAGLPAGAPFWRLDGKEVHEVAVGPVHAGVIEPGHFRFMCHGELVHHLEIRLGYQHRGVERLLLAGRPLALTPLVETIAGDTSVAHAWAHAAALEGLAGWQAGAPLDGHRGLGLELERIGMHLAGLSGLAGDVAFLQGATTYGRLRTTAINATMRVCGSRFGRGWVRPGAIRGPLDEVTVAALRAALALLERDLAPVNRRLLEAGSVRHRLEGVGVVTPAQALELGLVGQAARASGQALDLRASLPGRLWGRLPVAPVVEPGGDCWARALVRLRELECSLAWCGRLLDAHPRIERAAEPLGALSGGLLAVAAVEGWRGEVVHALETDAAGRLRRARVQDPSLRNWHGLAISLRGNAISDFPICNKSFDLSYCGNDL